MKKVLAWVLLFVLVLGMFAGCKKNQDEPTTPSDASVATPEGPTAEDAMAYLCAMYKDTEEPTPTPVNYDRYGIVRIAGVPFTVVWTVDVEEDLIKIIVNDDGTVTIDVNESCEVATPYTLTATITDEYGGIASHSWDMVLPAAADMVEIVKAAYALAPGESLPYESTLRGKIISIDTVYNPEYKNITVTIVVEGAEDMPIQCYRMKGEGCENLMVGNIITVTGTLKNYNGTIEFDSGCTLDYVEQGDAVEAPTDTGEILKAAYALGSGEALPYPVTLTGTVTKIDSPYDANYGNISVIIEMEGYSQYPVLCYRLKGTDVNLIAVKDLITVTGIIKNYNGTIEFDSGCIMTDRVSGGGVAKQESFDKDAIMADAKKLSSGQSLDYYATLTGKVTEIESPYDKNYGNITVVMQVSGYESTPITCYRLKSGAYDVSKIAKGDTITVRGVIENYNGKLEFGSGCTLQNRVSGGGVAKPETSDAKTIMTDAKALSSGETLDYYATLTGKVTEIESPYDKNYGNITVVMQVSGYESTPITCYRLKSGNYDCSKIAVGDTITVRGVIENYNGKLEFGSGCTLEKRVSGGGTAKPESSNATTILADAAKLATGEKLDYYANLTGKVTEIDTPYDKEYGNISVYMTVNGTSIYCYRLKSGNYDCSKIAVGDTITVRGVIENYSGEIQFGSGSTLEKRVSGGGTAKPESSDAATILADAAKLATGEKLDYYANLTGKVTEIDTPYDKEYGNISVYMTVNGTSIYCYRLKSGNYDCSKIAVGDTITVRGVIENYSGEIQFGSGSTLVKRVSGGGVAAQESSDQAKILADAAKLATGEKLDYYANLTGKVTAIDTPYDSSYGNISVVIDVNGTSMLCYRLKSGDADASKIAVNDTITVRGVIENYKGEIQFGSGSTLVKRVSGGGVAKPETDDLSVIWADAQKLATGESLTYYATITGKVTKINEAYTTQYGNTSVYIDLENGENILCYRMKSGAADASKIRVGDTITVRGVMMNYQGNIQMGQGCTLEKLVAGYNPGDNMTAKEILTAAYALQSASSSADKQFLEGQYTLTGVISSVDTAYSSQYNNITVTMVVEGCEDMPIQAYRLASGAADASGLKVGDTITVTGAITKYNNKVQFDQGCVLDAVVKGEGGEIEIPDGAVTIDFGDINNRVSYSTEQQVWQQNGITVTNDKASSSNNVYNNTSSNDYARFYKSSKLTVEYPGMTRLIFTHTSPYNGTEYVNGLTNALASRTDVVVTINDLTVIVDLKEAADSFVVESLAYQIRLYDITVCTGTTPPEDGGNLGGDSSTVLVPEMVTSPVADTAYKLYVEQNGLGKTLYFAGSAISETLSYYMKTTEDPTEATDVYLENVDDGYRLYFMNNGVKTYMDMYNDDTHYSLKLTTEPSTVYSYNTQYNTLTSYVVDTDCYMGSYGSNDTISCSKISYITSSTSYIAHLGTLVEGEAGDSGDTGTQLVPQMVTSPVAGTAYKLYVEQNGLSKTLYFAGSAISETLSYYMKTTEDPTEATDVYLENVDDGYRLYFMNNGVKTYMDMYNDDTHYSLKLTTEPSTVYSYNTQYNTLTSYVVDTDCYMGSYGSNDTISCSKISYITSSTSYISHLGTLVEGEAGGSGDQGGADSGSVAADGYGFVDAPVADTAYKFGMYLTSLGNDNYYVNGAETSDQKYAETTTNVAEAMDIYLEEVTGGYSIYYLDGTTKVYLNVTPRETDATKVRINFQTAAEGTPSVYTLNTEYKYLQTTVNSTAYVIGSYTYSGTTYTTMSASLASYLSDTTTIGVTQFPAWFLAEGEGGSSGDESDGNDGAVDTTGKQVVYTIKDYRDTSITSAGDYTHTLDSNVTVELTASWLHDQLRVYNNDVSKSEVIVKSAEAIKALILNVATHNTTNTGLLNVYGSNDNGATWTEIDVITVTGSTYVDVSVGDGNTYSWIKFTSTPSSAPTTQVRIAVMTLVYPEEN